MIMDENKLFKQEAKIIVDSLFDNGLLINTLTRDDMSALEEYLRFSLENRFNSYKLIKSLNEKINKHNK
jgi:hypothetical protein